MPVFASIKKLTSLLYNRSTLVAIFNTAALFLAFVIVANSYKEVWSHYYGKYHFLLSCKEYLKDILPLSCGLFLFLQLCRIAFTKNKQMVFHPELTAIIAIHTLIINLISYNRGLQVTVILCTTPLVAAPLVWLNIFLFGRQELLGFKRFTPPIIYDSLESNVQYLRENVNVIPFYVGFACIIISALTYLLGSQKLAGEVMNIAYISLVIGASLEVYNFLIKNGKENS
jgi:hypothetical protein